MSAVETNKDVVREFTRVFKNEHNVDGIDHLFAPDFEHHFTVPVSPGLRGLQEIGRIMNTAFPDVVVTELDLIATEDTVVERSAAMAKNAGPISTGRPPMRPVIGRRSTFIGSVMERSPLIGPKWPCSSF
jgi:hypothetical protein